MSRGHLAANRGKLFVIIPTHLKPLLPVEIEITEMSSGGCTVELKPVESGGARGYKAAGKEDRWQYEVHKPITTPFGRTLSEMTPTPEGNLEVRTIEPLKIAIARGPRKQKTKALTRVDKAVQTILQLPAPAQHVNPASIGELVRSINTLKSQMGSAMTLKVSSNGLLTATLEYS